MSASIAPRLHPVMTVKEYYRHPAVRARIREYCGGTDGGPLTCAHLVALTPGEAMPTWESATRHPPEDLDRLLDDGADVARSMLDAESLIFYLDLDYLNADHPAEAFLHSADVFFTLEPTYRAAHDVLRSFGMAPLEVVTGRGHHFAGRIPWSDPVIQHLADLAPEVPAWHASIASRHPACTRGLRSGDADRAPRPQDPAACGAALGHPRRAQRHRGRRRSHGACVRLDRPVVRRRPARHSEHTRGVRRLPVAPAPCGHLRLGGRDDGADDDRGPESTPVALSGADQRSFPARGQRVRRRVRRFTSPTSAKASRRCSSAISPRGWRHSIASTTV